MGLGAWDLRYVSTPGETSLLLGRICIWRAVVHTQFQDADGDQKDPVPSCSAVLVPCALLASPSLDNCWRGSGDLTSVLIVRALLEDQLSELLFLFNLDPRYLDIGVDAHAFC